MSTFESPNAIWDGDLLDRENEAKFLQTYLAAAALEPRKALDRGSFVLNVKGEWGSGKSFFLRKFSQQLRSSGKLVVEVNAWRADPDIDPLVTIVAAIKHQTEKHFPTSIKVRDRLEKLQLAGGAAIKHIAVGAVKQAAKKFVGDGLSAAVETLEDIELPLPSEEDLGSIAEAAQSGTEELVEKTFKGLNTGSYFKKLIASAEIQRIAINNFCRNIERLSLEIGLSDDHLEPPIFVIIDELDRCRPLFAIRLLERINHLFDAEGVVFILGTDSDELSHSVQAIYGLNFDGNEYLNRFFSYTYHLATPNLSNYLDMLFKDLAIDFEKFSLPSKNDPRQIIKEILLACVDTPRNLRQVLFVLSTFSKTWTRKGSIDAAYAAVCAILVFSGTKSDLPNIVKGSTLEANVGNKLLNLTLKYYDDDGRNTSIRMHSYVEKLNQLGRQTVGDSSKGNRQNPIQLRDHIARLLEQGTHTENEPNHLRHFPIWTRYIELMKTTSRLQELGGS